MLILPQKQPSQNDGNNTNECFDAENCNRECQSSGVNAKYGTFEPMKNSSHSPCNPDAQENIDRIRSY